MSSNTPYMNLTLPTPGGDAGTWDTELNGSLGQLDSHNHTPGMGALVPTDGLNIDKDLDFGGNKAFNVKGAQFNILPSAPTGNLEKAQLVFVNGDLWAVNGDGVAVQVTNGTSVATSATSNTPPGMIVPFGGITAPAGYLLANGAAVSRSTYSDLFGVIGTTYGVGDGTSTFNLPNAAGRTLVGAGTYADPTLGTTTRSVGDSFGEAAHVLTENELAVHTHAQDPHSHILTGTNGHFTNGFTILTAGPDPDTGASIATTGNTVGYMLGTNSVTAVNEPTGASVAHNNMQPSLVVSYIIKT